MILLAPSTPLQTSPSLFFWGKPAHDSPSENVLCPSAEKTFEGVQREMS
jgi:hypothetical protein